MAAPLRFAARLELPYRTATDPQLFGKGEKIVGCFVTSDGRVGLFSPVFKQSAFIATGGFTHPKRLYFFSNFGILACGN